MQYISRFPSPLGEIFLAGNQTSLTGLWFANQKYFASPLKEDFQESELAIFDETKHWLASYFEGQNPGPIPPVYLNGTDFQMRVWNILMNIPYGTTMTYGEIASQIAKQKGIPRMSAQAVGGAVGRNPISIIVPCHRVIGMNGSLTGYAGGLDTKKALLLMEGIKM